MRRFRFSIGAIPLLIAVAPPCFAQQWETGGAFGYSFFRNVGLNGAGAKANAGFSNGVLFSVFGGQDLYRFVGGEARYTYTADDLKLSSGGREAELGGESHAFHYDLLLYATPKEARLRPFAAAGAGARFYRGTGAERAFQPLNQVALLTRTSEWEPLVSVGGGLKYSVTRHVLLRVDVRDYATPFPTKLILPMEPFRAGGWLHDLVPMFGISATF